MPTGIKTALVLSGGSMKGTFQAGAIRELLIRGLQPDAVYGISVGALNGAYLANASGEAARRGVRPDWRTIGQSLWDFWVRNVRTPRDIVRRRSTLHLAYAFLFKKFNGLTDTKPLHDLVRRTISEENLRAAPLIFKVGCVNMGSGELLVEDITKPDARGGGMIEYILASAAIPIVMPLVKMEGQSPSGGPAWLTDGGVRDVALIGKAIDDGADRIICILCQTEHVSTVSYDFGNLIQYAERLMEIIVNETVNNDLETALRLNALLPSDGSPMKEGPLAGKRRVEIGIIRPQREPAIGLETFAADDVLRCLEMGRDAAREMRV